MAGLAGLMAGDPAQAARAAQLLRGVVTSARTAQDPVQLTFAGHAAVNVGDDADAADLLGRAVDAARAAKSSIQVARTKPAITVPSRWPASSCRKWPAPSMTG